MADPTIGTRSSTPLPTTDEAASTGDTFVVDAVKAAESAAESAIIAAEPVMATPGLKQIWEGILDWLCGFFGKALGTLTGFVIIDAQKYAALSNAASALARLQAAQKAGDPSAIAQANSNADAAVAPILHYVGSVQPK